MTARFPSLPLLLVALGLMTSACSDTDSGSCPAPDDNIMWFHIYETNGFLSQTKCVLCDASVPEEDWLDWALNNADPAGTPSNLSADEATPCLYVYGDANESEAKCEAAVCSGNPEINDPVQQGHGAWTEVNDYLPNASTESQDEDLPGTEGEEEEAETEGTEDPTLL